MPKRKDDVEVRDPSEAMRRLEAFGRRVLAVPRSEIAKTAPRSAAKKRKKS